MKSCILFAIATLLWISASALFATTVQADKKVGVSQLGHVSPKESGGRLASAVDGGKVQGDSGRTLKKVSKKKSKSKAPSKKPSQGDTCFPGFQGVGCFKFIQLLDIDCCYFSTFRPDGQYVGIYIGEGKFRIIFCLGAYCAPPYGAAVGDTINKPSTSGLQIFSNTYAGIIDSSCCNPDGLLVGITYS
jgi:hypothetical protein